MTGKQEFPRDLLRVGAALHPVETGLWSTLPPDERDADYDRLAAAYDLVVGNGAYNRVVWGCPTGVYADAASQALAASAGPLLDCGCGSLVFTGRAYRAAARENVMFLDRSLAMLRRARERVPDGRYLQGDALALPFGDARFDTVAAWGLLHVFGSASPLLGELARVARPGGMVFVSTLVTGSRWSGDAMLRLLHRRGEAAEPETAVKVEAAFGARFDVLATRQCGSMMFLTGRVR